MSTTDEATAEIRRAFIEAGGTSDDDGTADAGGATANVALVIEFHTDGRVVVRGPAAAMKAVFLAAGAHALGEAFMAAQQAAWEAAGGQNSGTAQ